MLLLFDLDGTLLRGATDAHRDALHQALLAVHSVDVRRVNISLSAAGRTDPEIMRAILLAGGVSAQRIDARADAVREECCRLFAQHCPADLSDTVIPGVRALLAWLSGLGRVTLGLLTGNYEPVARLKLARAGVGTYFPSGLGAFGSDAEDRAALPAIARRRAGERGRPHPRTKTVLIGDTPWDIACAKADEVRCAAVATGPFDVSELVGADWVAGDTDELRELLEEVL